MSFLAWLPRSFFSFLLTSAYQNYGSFLPIETQTFYRVPLWNASCRRRDDFFRKRQQRFLLCSPQNGASLDAPPKAWLLFPQTRIYQHAQHLFLLLFLQIQHVPTSRQLVWLFSLLTAVCPTGPQQFADDLQWKGCTHPGPHL